MACKRTARCRAITHCCACVASRPHPAQVKELGRGCFGSVWLAKWRGVEVALKEVLNPSATDTAALDIFNEAERLASLRHPCVMAFYGVVTSPGNCATVAEYICHGSLRGGLQKVKRKVRQKRGLHRARKVVVGVARHLRKEG